MILVSIGLAIVVVYDSVQELYARLIIKWGATSAFAKETLLCKTYNLCILVQLMHD
jgi:hypothetical protein